MAEFRFRLRGFLAFSEAAAEAVGISAQQYQLLQVVGTLPEGVRASISVVAERMVLRHNSAVELVDRAVRLDLVTRSVDEADHRRSIVVLTPHGAAVLDSLLDAHSRELRARAPALKAALEELLAEEEPAPRRRERA